MKTLIMVAFCIALTACTTTKTVTKVVERKVEIPKSLLTCSDEPVAGSVWITEKDVARYLVLLAEAGEDCRLKHAAVVKIVTAK